MLAPVGISIYKRLEHLKQTVSALAENPLAESTELFLFSDGPRPGDEAEVASVRDYLRSIEGFKSITIVERESNSRIYNNRQGHKFLLGEYGKMIWLEEDIVVAPHFLSFMNEALDRYEDDASVFSITGYSPPISIPPTYRHKVYKLMRFNAWGFATWADRYRCIDYVSRGDYLRLIKDRKRLAQFKAAGADVLLMLRMDVLGIIDALDVKAMYWQFINNRFTIYPVESLTRNIGFDGSGLHCYATDKFDVDLDDAGMAADELGSLDPDAQIIDSNRRFRQLSLKQRVSSFLYGLKLVFGDERTQ